jgi:uncharacterized protein YcgI (DUF1989 family)
MSPKLPPAPADAALRRAAKPTVVYPAGAMGKPDMAVLEAARQTMVKTHDIVVPPRDARTFRVPRGQFFRIVSIEGPQVGDLNLWNADNLSERFFSGKTRAARNPCRHGRPALEHLAASETDGHHQLRHARLVRLRFGRCRHPRRHRHALRSLH